MFYRNYFVYELIDPRTDIPRYVGITATPNRRWRSHIDDSDTQNWEKRAWIRELMEEGLVPDMQTIERVRTREEALEREEYWIRHYLQQGIPLTNIAGTPSRTPHRKTKKPTAGDCYTRTQAEEFLEVDHDTFTLFKQKGLVTPSRGSSYSRGDIEELYRKLEGFRSKYGSIKPLVMWLRKNG
jgi:uncharacterized protein YjhX (UPF0386 family)